MVKNDFLLRALLFFGFFWAFKLVFETVCFIYGWFREQTNWFAIIAAAIIAFFLQLRTFNAISLSITTRMRLTASIRWVLYVLLGYAFYITIIKVFEAAFYDKFGFWDAMNNGRIEESFKAWGIILLALVGSFFLTRIFVGQVGFIIPNEGGNGQRFSSSSLISNGKQPEKDTIRTPNEKQTIHGSAHFSDFNTSFNKSHNLLSNDEMYRQFDQHGGYVIAPNFAKYTPHAHAVTIAGAGQGKGTTAIINNLLSRPKDNWIILDVKGENAAVTARFQREAGQRIFILDPFGVQSAIGAKHGIPSSGYNPLSVAQYLPEEEKSDFAAMLAEMFVPESKGSASADGFFTDSARNTVKTYILHLITDKEIDDQDRHLGKLYQWLRLPLEDEAKLWIDMEYNDYTKYAVNEFKSIALSAPQTWGGIIANARRATAFLDSPLIQRSLSNDDFDPMLLQTGNTTVYVILPERNLNTHKTWLRLVFGTTLKLCNFVAKRRVNFLMDEFPILGRMDDFLRAFAFGRGQKISCWIFAQSLSQLKEIYGEEGLNTFLSNARLRQFFGMNDYYTQNYVSDLLGMTTEITTTESRGSNSGSSLSSSSGGMSLSSSAGTGTSMGTNAGESEQIIQRKLMTPDEVGRLKDEFVLFVDGDKYRVHKMPYYTPRLFDGRYDPNPYVHQ